jgi:hypothetical protein
MKTIPEWPKDALCEVATFYSDTPIGKRGTIVKSYTTPENGVWVKLYFGRNLSGQKLIKTYPSNCLKRLDVILK